MTINIQEQSLVYSRRTTKTYQRILKYIDFIYADENALILEKAFENDKYKGLKYNRLIQVGLFKKDEQSLIKDLYLTILHYRQAYPDLIITPVNINDIDVVEPEEVIQQNDNIIINQQPSEVLEGQEQAPRKMKTSFNNAKEKFSQSFKKTKEEAVNKWNSLSNKEKAAILSSIQTATFVPVVWKMSMLYKIGILTGIGVGSYFLNKKLFDKIDELTKTIEEEVNNPIEDTEA